MVGFVSFERGSFAHFYSAEFTCGGVLKQGRPVIKSLAKPAESTSHTNCMNCWGGEQQFVLVYATATGTLD